MDDQDHENLIFRLIKSTSNEQILLENVNKIMLTYRDLMMTLVQLTKVSQEEQDQIQSPLKVSSIPKENLNKQRQELLESLKYHIENINKIITKQTEINQEDKETEVFNKYGETMFIEPVFLTEEYISNCSKLRNITMQFYHRFALVQKQLALRRALIQQLQNKLPEVIKSKLIYQRQIAYYFDDIAFTFQDQLMKNAIIQYLSQEKLQQYNINLLYYLVNCNYDFTQNNNDPFQNLKVFSNFIIASQQTQPNATISITLQDIVQHQPQTISNQAEILKEKILIQLIIESIHSIFQSYILKTFTILQETRNSLFSIKHPSQLDQQEILLFQQQAQQRLKDDKLKIPFYSLNNEFINSCKHIESQDQLISSTVYQVVSQKIKKISSCTIKNTRYVFGEFKGFVIGYLEFV